MAKIIPLPGNDEPHDVQLLLPWYVTGQLEHLERARVDAHLKVCARCRAELAREQQLERGVAELTPDVERGWAALQARLDEPQAGAVAGRASHLLRQGRGLWRRGGPWIGWAAAAGLGALLLAGVVEPRQTPRAIYHTLSSPVPAPPGDLLVMFRPEATADQLAGALRASGARIADGPTAAGAYVLRTPLAERPRALASLRADKAVVLAEPLDAGSPP